MYELQMLQMLRIVGWMEWMLDVVTGCAAYMYVRRSAGLEVG